MQSFAYRKERSMSKASIFILLILVSITSPAFAGGWFGPSDGFRDLGYTCYGCTTPAFSGSVIEMRLAGIFPNMAMYSAPETDLDLKAADGTCRDTDYLALARMAHALATSGNIPRPFLLDLSGVIFGTTPQRSCTVGSDAWSLRSDWQARLNTFKMTSGTDFNTSTVSAIVVFTEVANQNGIVASNSVINQVAAYVKSLWPGIPVMAGYPTAATQMGYGLLNTPSPFPFQLDYIATWDYTVTSPTDPLYAGDAMQPGAYGGLLSRLRSYQKLIYVVGAFSFSGAPTTCPARSPINGERFDLLLRNWCSWAFETHGDRSLGIALFTWGAPTYSDPAIYGSQRIVNWEVNNCGGTALKPALNAVANAAATGSSCWTP
jgi:hypothetical protein